MTKLVFVVLPFVLAACQSSQKFQEEHCSHDGGYEQGANDAKHGKDLQGEAFAVKCPEQVRADVRKGYRDGYQEYSEKNRSIVDVIKDKVKTINDKPVTCRDNKKGEEVCGYGCAEMNGEVKCAQKSTHACVGVKNEIACGLNCREKSGKVVCDERETL